MFLYAAAIKWNKLSVLLKLIEAEEVIKQEMTKWQTNCISEEGLCIH